MLGDDTTITGSHLLVATGRRSNSDLLGPDHGIETDERGFLEMIPAPPDRAARNHPGRPGTSFVIRHKAAVAYPEPPRSIRFDRDADSWPDHDHLCFVHRKLKRHWAVAEQVTALVLRVQTQGLGEPTGTPSKITIARPPAS